MSAFRQRAWSNSAGDDQKERELPPVGTYKARLVGIYDIGTQEGMSFEGRPPKPRHQILLQWELFKGNRALVDSRGNQFTISAWYTLSLHEKANLRKDIKTITGKAIDDGEEFDISDLLGSGCRLQVSSKVTKQGKTTVEVASLMALDEDERTPSSPNEPFMFEITGTNCEIPKQVPPWVADQIRRSPEWQGTTMPSAVATPDSDRDDDIPF